MPSLRRFSIVAAAIMIPSLAVVMGIPASAAPLSPIAGERVVANSAIVASEIQEAIAEGETDAAAELRQPNGV